VADVEVSLTIVVKDSHYNETKDTIEQARFESDEAFMARVQAMLVRLKEGSRG